MILNCHGDQVVLRNDFSISFDGCDGNAVNCGIVWAVFASFRMLSYVGRNENPVIPDGGERKWQFTQPPALNKRFLPERRENERGHLTLQLRLRLRLRLFIFVLHFLPDISMVFRTAADAVGSSWGFQLRFF